MKRVMTLIMGIATVGLLATVVSAVEPHPGSAGNSVTCDGHGPRGALGQRGAMGQRGGMRGVRGGERMMRRMMALDLSTEQASQLRTIKTNTKKQIIPKEAELEVARVELREIMGQAKVNKRELNAKIDEMGALRTEIQRIKMNAMLSAREVLTSEQLTKLLDPTWRPHGENSPGDGRPGHGMRRGR